MITGDVKFSGPNTFGKTSDIKRVRGQKMHIVFHSNQRCERGDVIAYADCIRLEVNRKTDLAIPKKNFLSQNTWH